MKKRGVSMQEKTNVMRILDSQKINYKPYYYNSNDAIAGQDVASLLGENPSQVFKTLVTRAHSKLYYVFVIPVSKSKLSFVNFIISSVSYFFFTFMHRKLCFH